MKFEQEFNAADVDTSTPDFEPIPEGWYAMIPVEFQEATAKSGSKYVKIRLQIDENAHPNVGPRVLFHNLNLWNANEKARGIAERELAQICQAVGIAKLQDSAQVEGQVIAGQVTIGPGSDQYPKPQNKIRAFDDVKKRIGGQPSKPAAEPSPANQGTSKPSWV